MKILGREPSLWLTAVAATLALLASFNIPGLSPEQAALIVVGLNAVLGVVNALLVRPVSPAAFTYLVASAFSVAGAYGFEFTEEQVGLTNMVVLGILALALRGQVSPQPTAITRA